MKKFKVYQISQGADKKESYMNWRIMTEDNHVSLHDHLISDIHIGNDITLYFDNGFDVKKENLCNKSGRHKRTGRSAVVLHDAVFMKGIKFLPEEIDKKMDIAELVNIDLEVLEFSFDHNIGKIEIFGDAWDECLFCKLEFKANKVSYCWNVFVDDAWFQD